MSARDKTTPAGHRTRLPMVLFAALAWGVSSALGAGSAGPAGQAAHDAKDASKAKAASKAKKPRLDHSGIRKRGKASYYSRRFAGRTMADGTPMNPASNAAASRTLPLGTTARVTNLENGRSAVVEIRDRGPYVGDRSIDVTPKTARELDMTEQGVVPVEIAPIEVPAPGKAEGRPGEP